LPGLWREAWSGDGVWSCRSAPMSGLQALNAHALDVRRFLVPPHGSSATQRRRPADLAHHR
jgi:hypothetical protein